MKQQSLSTFQCEVISKSFNFVGMNVTAPFPSKFPDAAINLHQQFEKRMHEISKPINRNVLCSPHMCNEIIATYFACLEVVEASDVPADMVHFELPETRYAKVSCSNLTIDEGYDTIFKWMEEKEMKQKYFFYSMPVELYYLDDNSEEFMVEILIPIVD
ncbi:GyrI-like domain-containing protein [Alkalihalobacillus pseudalcaliphilus]|uniref:GyrI-like domain-containing protein n=1 Tax=Alkalihalobacillus pseudalcaliphilus TaxID=79884 RepID=UPI00064D9218|nr:effector binding domain-containing protein [Alkalihalobacillus pseudalcaliphilus]KMK78085.1 transcription activator effector-binding protein [Alkalihalobacillus pseudalcaliphilus]